VSKYLKVAMGILFLIIIVNIWVLTAIIQRQDQQIKQIERILRP
jgi:hypothetical protein